VSQLSPETDCPDRLSWQVTWLCHRKGLRAPPRAGSQLHAGATAAAWGCGRAEPGSVHRATLFGLRLWPAGPLADAQAAVLGPGHGKLQCAEQ